jgi:DNA-binding Lrp family transcriptional regulator
MLNPVLRYCEVPKPLEQYILYYIWKSDGHSAFQADLLKDLGIDRDRLRSIIAQLQQDGYITIEKIGNKLKLQYNRGLFRLKGVVDNELGKKIAMKVMVNYFKQGYTITRGRQEGDIRPDFVAFPFDKSTYRPKYTEGIAIEIESPNEIDVHPEQVRRNLQKYIPIQNLFKEIHIWTSEDAFPKLKQIYDGFLADPSIPQEYKAKVKIFSVRLKKKVGQEAEKRQKPEELTGEFIGKEREKLEKVAQQEIVAQGAVANEATEGKLGSLTPIESFEIQGIKLTKYVNRATVVINDKEYMISSLDYNFMKMMKEKIVSVKVQGDKLIISYQDTRGKLQIKEITLR